MKLESAPVFEYAGRMIEVVADAMRLLRSLPDHVQAPEWKAEIGTVRKRNPEAWAMARLIVGKDFAKDDLLREEPSRCERCHGSGRYQWPRATRESFCSCPTGEAMQRGKTLEEDAFERGITDAPPDVNPDDQLLLSWGGV